MTGDQASRMRRANIEMLGRPSEIEVLPNTIAVIAAAQMSAAFNQ